MLLCVPVAVADGLPDLGDSSQMALTPQDERRIGEEIMRDVNASGDVIKDIEVVDYLQGLGYRLAANSGEAPQKFTFFVVQDPSINAFALPGGQIKSIFAPFFQQAAKVAVAVDVEQTISIYDGSHTKFFARHLVDHIGHLRLRNDLGDGIP